MQPFQLTLSNNGTVTGLQSIPSPPLPPANPENKTKPAKPAKPLIVGIHGGFYNSNYFDATPTYSAAPTSTAFNVPFVAIDRPCYGGTTSILPLPSDSNFPQETGQWLHRWILPKLWTEFGVTNGCTCIVLLCHSLGVTAGVVTAALHAERDLVQDETENGGQYPLGGLIGSGMGNTSATSSTQEETVVDVFEPVDPEAEYIRFPLGAKNAAMFNKPGTVPDEVLACSGKLDSALPTVEALRFGEAWMAVWKAKWACKVRVPVLVALVEDDPYFRGTQKEVEACVRAFSRSAKVEGRFFAGCRIVWSWELGHPSGMRLVLRLLSSVLLCMGSVPIYCSGINTNIVARYSTGTYCWILSG